MSTHKRRKNIDQDMLVRLYDLPLDWGFIAEQERLGVTIRKPIGPEKHLIVAWVKDQFGRAWASEADCAISKCPVSCFIAVKEQELLGFACYDATALGFFGPFGVRPDSRRQGTGAALLRAAMLDMKLKGYGYAIIGQTSILDYYAKIVGATPIPCSAPGLWKSWLR